MYEQYDSKNKSIIGFLLQPLIVNSLSIVQLSLAGQTAFSFATESLTWSDSLVRQKRAVRRKKRLGSETTLNL